MVTTSPITPITDIVGQQGAIPVRSSYGLLLRLGRMRVVILSTLLTVLASCGLTALMVGWSLDQQQSLTIAGTWGWSLLTAVVVPAILTPAIVLVMMDMLSHLERALQAMHGLASTDSLTGLRNRRNFLLDAARMLEQDADNDTRAWLLMVDVDDFKRINDTHGHIVGDAALVQVASICGEAVSLDELCARFGGEEFALLLRHGDGGRALSVAEAIRARVECTSARAKDGAEFPLSVSIGCARSNEAEPGLSALLALADDRLYQAKRAGKNRVIAGEEA